MRNPIPFSNLQKKVMLRPYFFFKLYNPFSFFNLNFDLKNYFFNILIFEFERESSGKYKGERKLSFHHNLTIKKFDLSINRFHSMRKFSLRYF